jgi:intracellular multiplication protein IcmF
MDKASPDQSLKELCSAVRKIILQLKPQVHALSFVLVIGKAEQGKSTLLCHSGLECVTLHSTAVEIYYNAHGIFVVIGEDWLNQSNYLSQDVLKQLNRCHRLVKITGFVLCIDINQLFISDLNQFSIQCKSHIQLLERFATALARPIELAIFFTKMDKLAGFCDFFQNEHESDLRKPLGFSMLGTKERESSNRVQLFKQKFDQLIDTLSQQVIQKMHPARSSIKRTHIREFPLQLAMLRSSIQFFMQMLSPRLFAPEAMYFTSSLQGGHSLDRLNKKIQQEYALELQEIYPQSFNYKTYFVEEALIAFQSHTSTPLTRINKIQKIAMVSAMVASLIWVAWLAQKHLLSASLLDNVSKELLAFDSLTGPAKQTSVALYHLSKVSENLQKIHANTLLQPSLQQLKINVRRDTRQYLQEGFLPLQLQELEQRLSDPRLSHTQRYQALKTYLMLGDKKHFSVEPILQWFSEDWQVKSVGDVAQKKMLFRRALLHHKQTLNINQQLVTDVRNYLNALPVDYLYYALAKSLFSRETQTIAEKVFQFPLTDVPIYFTKKAFLTQVQHLPEYAEQLKTDNWVLARQDLGDLTPILQRAYCHDYVTWWKNFTQNCRLNISNDYQSAGGLLKELIQSHSLVKLITLIQDNTKPDADPHLQLFNKHVASQFTELNLMSHSAVEKFMATLSELDRFLTTVAIVNDHGKTAFNIAKANFNVTRGESIGNPLSDLAAEVQQFPEPLAMWGKQLLNHSWGKLLKDARSYINHEWAVTVFAPYQAHIAHRFPLDSESSKDISMHAFNQFFSHQGILNRFIQTYLYPFLDISQPEWKLKKSGTFVMPISKAAINELIRANVITNMFFPNEESQTNIEFSLQKLNLDPIVDRLILKLGDTRLKDTQSSESTAMFHWPSQNAKLMLKSIEGPRFFIEEHGVWAFFKLLQKVNVLVDEEDSANLQILFEINGNSGRYLLKTQNKVNPFIPGILGGFNLDKKIV